MDAVKHEIVERHEPGRRLNLVFWDTNLHSYDKYAALSDTSIAMPALTICVFQWVYANDLITIFDCMQPTLPKASLQTRAIYVGGHRDAVLSCRLGEYFSKTHILKSPTPGKPRARGEDRRKFESFGRTRGLRNVRLCDPHGAFSSLKVQFTLITDREERMMFDRVHTLRQTISKSWPKPWYDYRTFGKES